MKPPLQTQIQYLFDSQGRWIAFRVGQYVFNVESEWIGWLPENSQDVVDIDGNYLGTIYPENRFYREAYNSDRGYPGYPGYPGYQGYPGYPGYAGYSPLPPGVEDINEPQVTR
jgi:hypothetical protein